VKAETKRKDSKLIDTLNNKYFYIGLCILVLIYSISDDRVLNEPNYFVLIRTSLAIALVSMFSYTRYKKFKDYYRRKFKDRLTVILFVGVFFFSIFLLQGIFEIPIALLIKTYAKDSRTETFECDIKTVATTGIDKVHFVFLGKQYVRYLNVQGHKRKELISDFCVKIAAKKSLGGSYYLESIELKQRF
jgi:hypothetical protein